MISNLHIKNIGIIDDIIVDFNEGLNILTGETGAGKTLIIDSLQIISGGRFSKEMIRKGADNCFIELCMFLPENENSIDGNIIITREINTNGRNLCKINGRMVTVNELKEFTKDLIDIHGQLENQSLLDLDMHINYLDNFIGEELNSSKEEYKILFEQYQEIKRELKNNFGDDKEKQRKLDLLKYQIDEIEEAKLQVGEDEKLQEEKEKINNSEKISRNLEESEMQISEIAIDSISNAVRAFEKIEDMDEKYKNYAGTLKSIYYDLQELARDISDLKDDINFDEEQINQIEERLNLINSLKRKYGNTTEEILNYYEEIKKEVNRIENLESYIQELKEKQKDIEKQMKECCIKISEIRKKHARQLEENINKQLQDLEMKNATFKVNIEFDENNIFTVKGLDKVEFLISTNKGEEEKKLIKIASGGEMSRIMLAIKNVLASTDKVPVLVFDEIDTGISGKAANSVSEKLKEISKHHQVLCVTHLANIAAKGDSNYYISKEIEGERTKTKIKKLNEEETIKEIARIASGEITQVAIEHARELRRNKN